MMDSMINQDSQNEETVLEKAYLPESSSPINQAETVPPFPDQFGGVQPPPAQEDVYQAETKEGGFSSAGDESAGIEPPPPPLPEEFMPTSFLGGAFAKLRKIVPIVLALIVVLVLGSLIFNKFFKNNHSGLGQKEATLTYWGLWEPESVMSTVIAEYQKDHPKIKINYSQESPQDYRERLQSAFARGEGPDIFRFHNTWVPMFKQDLAPFPAGVVNEADYYPVAAESLKIGESFYGVPLMMDSLALYINDDIFRAAGKTPPATWEEFQKLALELTVRDDQGRIQTAGAALGITSNIDHWPEILGLMMLQNGVDMAKVDASIGTDGRNLGVDALVFYTLFSRSYKVWDATLPSSTLAFAGGKLAMYFGPSWRIFNIQEINKNLNFRILPVPQLPGVDVSWASFWVEGVWDKSENKKEALDFLQYLSSKEVLEKIYQAEGQLRSFGELYPRQEMAELLSDNFLLAPFLSQFPIVRSWYLCSRTYDNGINDRTIKYFEDAVNSVNRGGNAQSALTTAAQGVKQLLSQYEVQIGP